MLGEWGRYFTSADEVAGLVELAEADPGPTQGLGDGLQRDIARYDWDDVAVRYERLCARLAARDFPRRRPSGRRHGSAQRG